MQTSLGVGPWRWPSPLLRWARRCWPTGFGGWVCSGWGRAWPVFFANLTPLFAAVMSALVLGDAPRVYHAAAFVLIVGGIVVSSRK